MYKHSPLWRKGACHRHWRQAALPARVAAGRPNKGGIAESNDGEAPWGLKRAGKLQVEALGPQRLSGMDWILA